MSNTKTAHILMIMNLGINLWASYPFNNVQSGDLDQFPNISKTVLEKHASFKKGKSDMEQKYAKSNHELFQDIK